MMRNIRTAARRLRATPAFTLVAVAILTLGIAATTTIFAVVDAVVLRPLPFAQGRDLVLIQQQLSILIGVAPQDYLEWRSSSRPFTDLAASVSAARFVLRSQGQPESLRVVRVSANMFDVLGVHPAIGRSFGEYEADHGQPVAVISDQMWRLRFGAATDIAGKVLTLDNGSWTIQGVMPPTFEYPVGARTEMWIPYSPAGSELVRGPDHNNNLTVIARLRPRTTITNAQESMQQLSAMLAARYPDWYKSGGAAVVTPLIDTVVPKEIGAWMRMLLWAAIAVLIVACANVAGLMIARANSRMREAAIQSALGASRVQIVRGLLVESLLISVTSATVGIAVAYWTTGVLSQTVPGSIPRSADISINIRVLAESAFLAIATGIGCGLGPALRISRREIGATLRDAGRSNSAGVKRRRMREILVVAEVGLAIVLTLTAGLFVSSFRRVVAVDLGFDHQHLVADRIEGLPRPVDAGVIASNIQRINDLVTQASSIDGVTSACAFDGAVPFTGDYHRQKVSVPNRGAFSANDSVDVYFVSPSCLKTMGLPTIRGRGITEADGGGGPATVVLNKVAASRYFGEQDPVGETLTLAGDRTVIGIVAAMRPLGPETELRPEAYISIAQGQPRSPYLLVRSSGARDVSLDLKRLLASAAPGALIGTPIKVDELYGSLIAQRRLSMLLLALFGFLAVAISSAGVYGALAHSVSERQLEFGIRMALGATTKSIVIGVVHQAGSLVAVGIGIGIAAGWVLTGLISVYLFKTAPHDFMTYGLSLGVVGLAGAGASALPAYWASRTDPVEVMKQG